MNTNKNPGENLLEKKKLVLLSTISQNTHKDNRPKALLFINIFALSRSILSILFKYLNQNGVSFAEFMVWRGFGLLVFSSVFLFLIKKNPFVDFPQAQKSWVYFRAFLGWATFLLSHYTLTLIPLALHTIIF